MSLQPHLLRLLPPLMSMRTTSNLCLDDWTLWPLAWGTSLQAWKTWETLQPTLTTSQLWLLKGFQLMMRTLRGWLNPLRKSMSIWGIMTYSYLFSYLFFMMPRGRKIWHLVNLHFGHGCYWYYGCYILMLCLNQIQEKKYMTLWSFWFHLLILFILIVICEPNQKEEILNENFGW